MSLANRVTAENVIEQFDCRKGMRIITFDYLCPNCGAQHAGKEMQLNWRRFTFVEYQLDCGRVRVLLPAEVVN